MAACCLATLTAGGPAYRSRQLLRHPDSGVVFPGRAAGARPAAPLLGRYHRTGPGDYSLPPRPVQFPLSFPGRAAR